MNLIEGGRPRIGCIRRQPSAGSLILSLEEGHPSMGKIAGSSRKGGRTSRAPQLPGDRRSARGVGVLAVPLAAGTVRAVACEVLGETKSRNKFGVDPSDSPSLLEEAKQQRVKGLSSSAWERYQKHNSSNNS